MDIQDENLLLASFISDIHKIVSKLYISNSFLLIYFSTKQKLSSETLKCFIIISLLHSRWLLVRSLFLINFFWPKINQLFVLFIDRLYPIILVIAPFPVHNPIPTRFFFPKSLFRTPKCTNDHWYHNYFFLNNKFYNLKLNRKYFIIDRNKDNYFSFSVAIKCSF